MENEKNQTGQKNDGTETSTEEETQKSFTSTGRPNIDDINKRNAEEEKQNRKSSYTTVGIVALLLVAVVIVIYFFG